MSTVETKLPEIHADTAAAAGVLEAALSFTNGDHVVTQDAYEKLIAATPEELAAAKLVHEKTATFLAAAPEAVGNYARKLAEADSKLESVTVKIPMLGKAAYEVTWTKQEERNAGIPKPGQPAEKKTVYGAISAKIIIKGADASVGELNKVAKRQKAFAHAAFGPKA